MLLNLFRRPSPNRFFGLRENWLVPENHPTQRANYGNKTHSLSIHRSSSLYQHLEFHYDPPLFHTGGEGGARNFTFIVPRLAVRFLTLCRPCRLGCLHYRARDGEAWVAQNQPWRCSSFC